MLRVRLYRVSTPRLVDHIPTGRAATNRRAAPRGAARRCSGFEFGLDVILDGLEKLRDPA
jgi:hypothetical protein